MTSIPPWRRSAFRGLELSTALLSSPSFIRSDVLTENSDIVLFPPGGWTPWRKRLMKTTCKLTDEQVQELQALENHPVDYTDIPQTTDFSKARLKYYTVKPVKQSITLRIDADVLAVLKGDGKGYQAKMNDILRAVVMEHRMPVLE